MLVGYASQGWVVTVVVGESIKRQYHVWARRRGEVSRVQLFYGKGGCMEKDLDPNGPMAQKVKQVILDKHPLPWTSFQP